MVRFKEGLQTSRTLVAFISIPIWFDLKKMKKQGLDISEIHFNSYMVRFKVRLGTKDFLNSNPDFNSYMVRFKELQRLL